MSAEPEPGTGLPRQVRGNRRPAGTNRRQGVRCGAPPGAVAAGPGERRSVPLVVAFDGGRVG